MHDETVTIPVRRAGLSRLGFAAFYVLMLAGAVVVFLLVRAYGERLAAPAPVEQVVVGQPPPAATGNVLFHVLLALAAVIALGRLLGYLLAYLGQPPVIGEVLAGILLGPSLLGQVAPEAAGYLLPQTVAPYLGVIAQVGVILYMFLVGLEFNGSLLRQQARTTLAIAHASMTLPFLLGAILALYTYPRLSSSDVPFTSFALFAGVAMAVTAFPVLARILTDRGMHKTELGVLALTCAAADDVTAWCLLAFVVGIAQAKVGGALLVLVWTAAYVAVMVLLVRPLVQRFLGRLTQEEVTPGIIALVLVLVLLSALATEGIGIHAIFGAFLLGALIPHDCGLARTFTHKLEEFVSLFLLPAFFALTGMRTQIGLLADPAQWLLCGLIILVATAGKFGGTFVSARLTGLGWREAAALGALMNTRGLMELIVLNIGLEMHVIGPTLFAMMVLMALVTTMATSPILQLLNKPTQARARNLAVGSASHPDEYRI